MLDISAPLPGRADLAWHHTVHRRGTPRVARHTARRSGAARSAWWARVPRAVALGLLPMLALSACGSAPAAGWPPSPSSGAASAPAPAGSTGMETDGGAAPAPGGTSPTGAASADSVPADSVPADSVPADSVPTTIPSGGNGRFGTAGGGSRRIGAGERLVRFRVEAEQGIEWRGHEPWTPARFAGTVEEILGAPRGWAHSATSPVTNRDARLTKASWSFRRVSDGDYDVRIRLATPATVDRLCGEQGMDTEGVYSCRFGETLMINLRRWLHGAPTFAVPIAHYRTGVINHEVGHFLGFAHMTCPGRGRTAPVMQQQTIDLGGCRPNVLPFDEAGRFVTGPWAPS